MEQIFCCIIPYSLVLIIIIIIFNQSNSSSEAAAVGVNYGMLGNNLPSPYKAISLLHSKNITRIRLFEPNHEALSALCYSGIEVILGTLNQDLPRLATDESFTKLWIQTNILPYTKTVQFRYISAGNEILPSYPALAPYILPAMTNLVSALKAANLAIPVTTCVSTAVLSSSYPPSQGEFSIGMASFMRPITAFLTTNKSPLLVNIYPYFSYINEPSNIALDYAIFASTNVVVWDGKLGYKNLFDATTDAMYAAMEKIGGEDVEIVVSESGWPSAENGEIATVENARVYNSKLMDHVCGGSGTPRRPGKMIETYLFALFNENLKPPGTEQNFGLYQPDMTQVYHLDFTC